MGRAGRDCRQRHPDGVLSCATEHLSRHSLLPSWTPAKSLRKTISVACYFTGPISETVFLRRKVAKVPALLTAIAVEAITGTVRGLGGLRLADLRVATPSVVIVVASAAALVLAMVLARRRVVYAIAGLLAILAASVVLAFIPPQPRFRSGLLEITSIDVGEGDSTLLVTPQGRALLVDAGGPIGGGSSQLDFGEDVVSPYLWWRGISRLDVVAITHGHSDHIGGMVAVLKNFRPRELWVALLPPSAALDRIIAEAHALGILVVRHWEGDKLNLG